MTAAENGNRPLGEQRDGAATSFDRPQFAGGGLGKRLGAEDAAFLYVESAEAPLNIGSVGIFEGAIPFEQFVATVEAKLHLIPRYRQRAIFPPFNIARPTWEFDPDFDIRRHIIRLRIDPPGSDEQLLDLAARLHEGRLERDKPLWEIYVIEGMEGNRTGMVSKVHHCLVDGVSGIELLMVTLDVSPNPPPPVLSLQPYDPPPLPDRATTLLGALGDRALERLNRWTGLQKSLVDLMMGGDKIGVRTIARALQMALPNFAIPVARAPFNRTLGGRRKLAGSEFPFETLRAIRKAGGGTVNDVVLTILGGALGRYLELHGQPTANRTMRVLTPVSVRRESETGTLGNRVSMLLVNVPVGEADPLARLRAITERTGALKANHAADGLELMAEAILGWSAPLMAAFGALGPPPNTVANIVCTNVPGPMIPLYTVGHRMLAGYPIVPLAWDLGVGCAVTSYDHKLYFGLTADAAAAPDVHKLKEFLDESYEELRAAAGVEETPPLHEQVPAAQEMRSA